MSRQLQLEDFASQITNNNSEESAGLLQSAIEDQQKVSVKYVARFSILHHRAIMLRVLVFYATML